MLRLDKNSKMENVYVNPLKHRVVLFTDSIFENIRTDSRTEIIHVSYPIPKFHAIMAKKTKHPKNKIHRTLLDFLCGVQDRFPLCCILHFCWDTLWWNENMSPSGFRRGIKRTKRNIPYIPCFYHSSIRR